MKNIYKNLVNGSFLGVSLLLGATACSDDHFDIKEQPGAEGGLTTIWQSIASNPELSDVADVLKVTRVMKDDKDDKATIMYSEWLDQPMEITAWLPKNGTFDKQYYLDILDSASHLASAGQKYEALRTEYQVVNQFVKNHIALFNFSGNANEQQVRLLNAKHCDFDMSQALFNGVAVDLKQTTRNSNGSLYVLEAPSQFAYNIYDYMSSDEDFSKVYSIISNPAIDKNVFWPEGSTQGAMNEKGEIVYVDSVFTNSNEILSRANALIKSEDSIYVAMIPTNEAWSETYETVKPLFAYGSSYDYDWDENKFVKKGNNGLKINVDSLSNLNTGAAIIESMFFNPTGFKREDGSEVDKNNMDEVFHYMLIEADSLISTNGVIYYNENANTGLPNPLFDGLTPIKASNGFVLAPSNNRIKPEYSFIRRYEYRPGAILINLTGCTTENGEFITLTEDNNWDKYDANLNPTGVVGEVEDNKYHFFEGKDAIKIRMRLSNLPSGHYKISAQMLPNRVNTFNVRHEADGITPIVESPLFDAAVYGDNMKRIGRQQKNLTVNQDTIQNVVLFEDFELEKSYMNLPSGYETFPFLEISMSTKQIREGKCNSLSIAKIVVEPIRK